MNTKQIPETGFLRLKQVLKVFPVRTTAWWNECGGDDEARTRDLRRDRPAL